MNNEDEDLVLAIQAAAYEKRQSELVLKMLLAEAEDRNLKIASCYLTGRLRVVPKRKTSCGWTWLKNYFLA